ncbi:MULTISPECIES: type I-C CRISPR-associated protein Cas8c/Csd1 [Paenibacillus]|uniref:Type I-C CRISPR-associated protein Cas8c/Csd1 n=2 Tax=Paenibacillus TaxID=44249 RepID=A0ABX2ZAV7_PAEPO|nr:MULTISPECIES: type I-C CRISPR-associated protein Cas8c/Csd1 [Paenibacillus]MDR6779104.1 CRISPR-associated protein Csd1 [Paenibacillus peoriae]ODA07934.1 type I-C CRISPR-associated protein Cas8c/Csd1 [Paenibacillus polymyxa]OME75010.1 type I-C CRISPR-associated protein Cas8c/Csd1 [Paenibacillus peoriae]
MNWLLNLYETYESNLDRVGVIEKKHNDREYTLLPISHTTQNAQIEVEVTEQGDFHSARILDKNEFSTLIPSTEKSASRAGSVISPYPLHDKLSYVAGDFVAYGGKIKKEEPFSAYIQQLEGWATSDYATSKVKSIYRYLSKRCLIKDLVDMSILYLDADQKLISTWDKKYEPIHGEKPPIFTAVPGEQESVFIRFNVYSPDKVLAKVWEDKEVYDSFVGYYSQLLGEEDICYVTGRQLPSTDKHANKIRNSGDKAKLISANDTSGFTFRGRFAHSHEAASISYEVSQKAHNALKWLINRQGKVMEQRVFLVWGNDEPSILNFTENDNIFAMGLPSKAKEIKSHTNEEFAFELAKALTGYANTLAVKSNSKAKVNILVLDSATTGRMAVIYYRNLDKKLYFEKLIHWHSTCVWLHRYRKDEQGEYLQFWGAPATKDIAFAAYGSKANDKLVKGLMERMLPCIVDGQNIPQDIVRSAINRASNPVSMDKWEWEKTLSVTCALVNQREGYNVALDKENMDRSYLFGRLLAIADVMERSALDKDEKRSTNAIRYMNAFSQHPERTWRTIQNALQPHQARLGKRLSYYSNMIDEVLHKIPFNEFNNKPLTGKYLLGLSSQRYEIYHNNHKKDLEGNNDNKENNTLDMNEQQKS